MVLTASQGSVKYNDIVSAVRNVYGKSVKTAKTKDIFMTEKETDIHQKIHDRGEESENETQEVMETIANQVQETDGYESEEALDIFEAYATVRKKMQEKKISRGYRPQSSSWQLTGTVKGKIEALKQKTKCHLCHRQGHWKRECPLKKNKGKSSGHHEQEVHCVDIMDSDDEAFDVYATEEVKYVHGKMAGEHHVSAEKKVKINEDENGQKVEPQTKRNPKDCWEVTDAHLIRHHHKVRKGLFSPTGMNDVPVKMERLSGVRKTEITYQDGEVETVEDNYQISKHPHEKKKGLWTGRTILDLKPVEKE